MTIAIKNFFTRDSRRKNIRRFVEVEYPPQDREAQFIRLCEEAGV